MRLELTFSFTHLGVHFVPFLPITAANVNLHVLLLYLIKHGI